MKKTLNPQQIVANHKRMLYDYSKYKDLKGRYNVATIQANVFTLVRIKDGSVIAKFDVNTFLPI